jgi:enoyl-CoA hydratase/carnithine racemase
VRSFGYGNRVAVDEARMNELFPPRAPGLRESYEHVLVRRDGHLLEVTINRPDRRNCLHPAANAELEEVLDAYFADPELWVAILTGAGDRAFCAGNDLMYMAGGKQVWIPKTGFGGLTCREGREKPVIAAVNGPALAGGFEIVLACDLVVAAENAEFGLTEVKVGLVAALGGIARLPRIIGPTAATEMILTGRRVGASEARELGLVNRLEPEGGALAGARELAAEILAGSPTSVRLSMRAMAAAALEPDCARAARPDPDLLDELLTSADAAEGARAFAEKRPPRWRNH